MVLRRLHAEYGVNAFFRVDVVAHPNFPDKSIVRVSFFFFSSSSSFTTILNLLLLLLRRRRLRLTLFPLYSPILYTHRKRRRRGKNDQHYSPFFYIVAHCYCCVNVSCCWASRLVRCLRVEAPSGSHARDSPQLDSTRSLIVYTFFNIIIISWLYASSQSDQVGSRFGIWRGWAWKIENNNKTLLLHVATNWRIIDLSSSSPPSTRVYARHHPTGRNANRDKQFPCQHATRHPPSSFL